MFSIRGEKPNGAPAVDEEIGPAADRVSRTVLVAIAQALTAKAANAEAIVLPEVKFGVDFYEEVERFEVYLIRQALLHTAGNQRKAASLLGLKPTTFHHKVRLYNISSKFPFELDYSA